MRLIFDLECDNLLDKVTKIHCLCAIDIDTRAKHYYAPAHIQEGIELLSNASLLVGHNILDFDLKVIEKLYGYKHICEVHDTLIISRLDYAHSYQADEGSGIPKELFGRHSLEAWGWRLGHAKGDFAKKTDWREYSPEMLEYCMQDVVLNLRLYERQLQNDSHARAWAVEHKFFKVIQRQYETGMPFDTEAALKRIDELKYKIRNLEVKFEKEIPAFTEKTEFTPKVNNKKMGYVKGQTIIKLTETKFNPRSRQHIDRFFSEKYGWIPESYTEKGNTELNETVLSGLEYPEAKDFLELIALEKELSKIEGSEASLMANVRNGRCYGSANCNGAVTGRMTHRIIANIPKGDFRKLFAAPDGYLYVGADAKALELRVLAHYLYPYDGGIYANLVTQGDVHTANMRAMNIQNRDDAKRVIFAILYGSGDTNLGSIVKPLANKEEQLKIGKDIRGNF